LASDVEITSDFTKNIYLDIACSPDGGCSSGRYPQSTEVFSEWGNAFSEIYLWDEAKKKAFSLFIFFVYPKIEEDLCLLVAN
jgi:hypothetical protein